MNKYLIFSLVALILVGIDYYVFQAFRVAFQHLSWKRYLFAAFWLINGVTILALLSLALLPPEALGKQARNIIGVWAFMSYFSKTFIMLFLAIDDVVRLGQWVYEKIIPTTPLETAPATADDQISRSEFLAKAGLIVATVPLAGMTYGIISGAHDYRIRRTTLKLPNLPAAFDGLRIAQLSDIHSGSFFNKKAVRGGVEMLLGEKPDVVFFTGDLVNNTADEVKDYIDVFDKLKAPLGVYSTLGNHDYGDYVSWGSQEAKSKNLDDLKKAHELMGWRLLMNEHIMLEQGGEKLAILGIENWGTGRFPKYGKLAEAYKGTSEAPVKILLSHDPSHWDEQVRKEYPDIDLMLAGHTHGMQFGIEIGDFKWSPVQYRYKQWAGLYQEGSQYLYVNRGFGYIGFPGRVGMPPEITIIELQKA